MTARELRDRIASAAATAHPSAPLRILARRRAPLVSQGQQLGYLEALLRLSLRGDGRGEGVVVFDWPTTAAGHSAVQILEQWSTRGEGGGLEVECEARDMERKGAPPMPGMHLKVHFDAGSIPDDLLELLGLADRLGISGAVAKQVAEYRPPEEPELTERDAAAEQAEAATEPAPEPEPAALRPDQDKIDRIEHHADYDPAIHPEVDPNEEVTTSEGEIFRLVVRRSGGQMRRQWIRVGRSGVAQQA